MCRVCIKKVLQDALDLKRAVDSFDVEDYLKQALKCPAMKALEELTPGGSEYYEDPKRCYDTIRDGRSNTHKLLIKTVQERNDAVEHLSFARNMAIRKQQEIKNLNAVIDGLRAGMNQAVDSSLARAKEQDNLRAGEPGWNTGLIPSDTQVLTAAIDNDLAIITRHCQHCSKDYVGTKFGLCSECGRFQFNKEIDNSTFREQD